MVHYNDAVHYNDDLQLPVLMTLEVRIILVFQSFTLRNDDEILKESETLALHIKLPSVVAEL